MTGKLYYVGLSGRILLTGDVGHVVFDTRDELLSVVPGDVKTGSQVVPARTAYSSGVDGTQSVVDVDTEYFLAALAIPGAHVVRGMIRSTWASNPEPADNLWRQASGTHLDILDGVSLTTVPQTDTGGYNRVATMGGYTLYINELGHLVLHERIVMRARDSGGPPAQVNRARQQATISFRLLIGFFLGADFVARPGVRYRHGWGMSSLAAFNQAMDAGYAFPGRRLIVVSLGHGTVGATAITIGGVAATIHGSFTAAGVTATVASAVVPSGESVQVAVTYPSLRSGIVYLFSGANMSGAVALDTDTASGTAVSKVVDATAGHAVLLASWDLFGGTSFGACAWSGADGTAAVVAQSGTFMSAAVAPRGSATANVTATWSPSGSLAMIAATFT